ncbi:unnamed protein product [Fusarium graminearum]|uniref:Chromosome 4, complete genome n=1 Tax=Gibberella zeae (strain ATCC MYA-4620 / CBS 123657 / FGSC 9075 / NRRL 31084 / PH-1) TaxID=229533 RepID=I1S8S2_GIBZE|nr:hypothetical protein FGSG_13250 [Fusarium graminearum PH-1]ESU14261.1 hypothetical protein FGSG_13250 [Fusarium graminearum PH-1]EYB30433.1 hypothetical protein FG05_13250 [Fusarium graminearum]CEF83894.1 unnamed protein product [Fusarium graminearum]CZS73915.1 unnamed protein product [Fusarium graminearum]|eukprot:XP_011327768.1 hypothetical protein FGSG_13250 [Fusarium graminearum PH-1]
MPAGGGVRSGDASEPRPGPRSIKRHGPEPVTTGESRQGHREEKWQGRRGKRGDDVFVLALVMLIDPDHRRWEDRQEPNPLGLQLAVNLARQLGAISLEFRWARSF